MKWFTYVIHRVILTSHCFERIHWTDFMLIPGTSHTLCTVKYDLHIWRSSSDFFALFSSASSYNHSLTTFARYKQCPSYFDKKHLWSRLKTIHKYLSSPIKGRAYCQASLDFHQHLWSLYLSYRLRAFPERTMLQKRIYNECMCLCWVSTSFCVICMISD